MRILFAFLSLGLVVSCGETITQVSDSQPPQDAVSIDQGPPDQFVPDQLVPDQFVPDQFVPDLAPQPCATPCDDGVDCTEDSCVAGKCVSTIKTDFCLIDGSCYATGTVKTGSECQLCEASTSSVAWSSSPQGMSCTDDGISCTDDVCAAGSCTHPLAVTSCYIGGSCYNKDEAVVGTTCQICRPELKTTLGSLVDGLACDDGDAATLMDLCLAGSCRGFTERYWDLNSSDTDYSVTAVANVPVHGLWTSVSYTGTFNDTNGATEGAMYHLQGTGDCTFYPWLPGCPGVFGGLTTFFGFNGGLRDLHHRLVVGDKGLAKHFKNLDQPDDSWTLAPAGDIVAHLGPTSNARSVWGADLNGGVERYFIATNGGISDCSSIDQGTTFTCKMTTGLPIGTEVHKVFGSKTTTGDLGNVWALRSNGFEDIYVYDALTSSWSNSSALGCADTPGTACGDTLGRLTDLWVDAKGEAWAVGEKGLLLRFDGTSWQRILISSLGADQSKYDFRGVYVADDLLLVVGQRKIGTNVEFFLIGYHIAYDLWFPAQVAFSVSETDPNLAAYSLNDIAGRGLVPLAIVGSRWGDIPLWTGQDIEQKPLMYFLK